MKSSNIQLGLRVILSPFYFLTIMGIMLIFPRTLVLIIGTFVVLLKTIGVNIESIITDGTKTVRAWTIVAEGEIQRPHYRYLIK